MLGLLDSSTQLSETGGDRVAEVMDSADDPQSGRIQEAEQNPEQLATARTLRAISLQVGQSLWGSGTRDSLEVVMLTPTIWRR